MSKRDQLIEKYTQDMIEKCGIQPDAELLRKVVIGCGPSIYNADASTVSGSDPKELLTVQKNFLEKKLGLADSPELQAGIDAVMEKYGRSNRNKYRAVVYYLLTVHFGRENVYK